MLGILFTYLQYSSYLAFENIIFHYIPGMKAEHALAYLKPNIPVQKLLCGRENAGKYRVAVSRKSFIITRSQVYISRASGCLQNLYDDVI